MAKKASLWLGIIFVVIGILGYVSNPIVGSEGLFVTNAAHDWVHIIFGIILIVASLGAAAKASVTMVVLGAVYLLVAVLGFFMQSPLFGLIEVNAADNWLHVVLGLLLVLLGKKAGTPAEMPSAAPQQQM